MRSIQFLLPLVALSAIVPVSFAQHGRLLVAQKGDRSLAIVDPAAGAVLASVDENGVTGHEVAGSPDGNLAVANEVSVYLSAVQGPFQGPSWSRKSLNSN